LYVSLQAYTTIFCLDIDATAALSQKLSVYGGRDHKALQAETSNPACTDLLMNADHCISLT